MNSLCVSLFLFHQIHFGPFSNNDDFKIKVTLCVCVCKKNGRKRERKRQRQKGRKSS